MRLQRVSTSLTPGSWQIGPELSIGESQGDLTGGGVDHEALSLLTTADIDRHPACGTTSSVRAAPRIVNSTGVGVVSAGRTLRVPSIVP